MQIKGMNLCDFCFEPIEQEAICPKCGLSHETYQLEAGLLPPGTNLMGKYIIGKLLGRGGFGATYMAYSSSLGKAVAIKEYLPVSIAYRGKGEESVTIVSEEKADIFRKGSKRFFEEAKTIARFNKNENIVSVYEFFYTNDTVYYSMEYLEGTDLKKYIAAKGGKLSEAEVISIAKALCNALIVIHSTQTLHRDISPDNIFMCSNGKIKLIDFGTAKQFISDESQSYSVVVKQGFAPSEQYTRKGNQGIWTDIYAAGATLYYALTGKIPPDAIERVENPEIKLAPDEYSPEMAAVINKCMHIKTSDRYQSALELLAALEKIPIKNEERHNTNQIITSVENKDKEPNRPKTIKNNNSVDLSGKPGKKAFLIPAIGIAAIFVVLAAGIALYNADEPEAAESPPLIEVISEEVEETAEATETEKSAETEESTESEDAEKTEKIVKKENKSSENTGTKKTDKSKPKPVPVPVPEPEPEPVPTPKPVPVPTPEPEPEPVPEQKTETKPVPVQKTETKTTPVQKTETKPTPVQKTETKQESDIVYERKIDSQEEVLVQTTPVQRTETKPTPVQKTETKSVDLCDKCFRTAHDGPCPCDTCGSTTHTIHPCDTCGSTMHTIHPCDICGSEGHATIDHGTSQ